MAKRGRRRVREYYQWDQIAETTEQLYQTALKASGPEVQVRVVDSLNAKAKDSAKSRRPV